MPTKGSSNKKELFDPEFWEDPAEWELFDPWEDPAEWPREPAGLRVSRARIR
jgi:hypothetical protein